MRLCVFLACAALCSLIAVPAALADDGPEWALISTEVDEFLDASGYMDRDAVLLKAPNYQWSGNPSDIVFDPGHIFGVDTGLDALHLMGKLVYFSTEVDVEYEGQLYRDEQLLCWNGSSLSTVGCIDIANGYLGDDYGLDAACYTDAAWIISPEVGGDFGDGVSFTDGDLFIVYNDGGFRIFDMMRYFGRNVGLDALHASHENAEERGDPEHFEFIFSTEVDGTFGIPGTDQLTQFRDEDILSLSLSYDTGMGDWVVDHFEVAWNGVDGMGRDVGCDALTIGPMIPEPGITLVVGGGLIALFLRKKRSTHEGN